jgi:hypothetical protein
MSQVYSIRGTTGGNNRIDYDGPTKANTAALSTVKILLPSVVSDNANFMALNIKDFYLMTPLPRSKYIRIPLKFLSDKILIKHPTFSIDALLRQICLLVECRYFLVEDHIDTMVKNSCAF